MNFLFRIRYKLVAALITLASIAAVCDLLIDFGENESLAHILPEAMLFLGLLVVCALSARAFLQTKVRSRLGRSIAAVLFCGSFLGVVSLSMDDVKEILVDAPEAVAYVISIALQNNFHEVVPGRFYRAGEMSLQTLEEKIRENKIRTVVDLRLGEDELNAKGENEPTVVKALNLKYFHVKFKSSKVPEHGEVEALLHAYDEADLPILVHCSSGTHRTGFASAVWLLEKEGGSRQQAVEQLSPRFGFFRFERRLKEYRQGAPTLDTMIWRYFEEAPHQLPFREWLKDQSFE